MKISVITPSIRLDALQLNKRCLERQTFRDFEWIVISPFEYKEAIWVPDPAKRENDFYRLNGAWNAGFKVAQGELFISIVDGIYFDPDTLEKFWYHYQNMPNVSVTGIGHQFKELQNGKPEIEVWHDPRVRSDFGSFYEIQPIDNEWVCTSLPKKAIDEIGGMDEDYDRVAALSEKDANLRMDKIGYKFYIDQTIEYRAIYHERLSPLWDEKYKEGCVLFEEKVNSLMNGTRSYRVN